MRALTYDTEKEGEIGVSTIEALIAVTSRQRTSAEIYEKETHLSPGTLLGLGPLPLHILRDMTHSHKVR